MKARSDADWSKDEKVWFTRCKLGHNMISRFMPSLSDELTLSKRYTGHCLRATATQNLCNAFVPNQHVMKLTGHRNEASLRSYNSRTTDGQRVMMAALLDTPIDEDTRQLQPPHNVVQPALLPPAPPKPTAPTSTALIPSTAPGADVEDDWDEGTVQEVMKAMGEVDPIPEPRCRGVQPTQKLQLSQLSTFAQGAAFHGCTFNF